MLLKDVLDSCGRDDEIEKYVYLEQQVNDGSPSGFTTVHQVTARFRPQLCNVFSLPAYFIPGSSSEAFTAEPSLEIKHAIEEFNQKVLFCLHPDLKKLLGYSEPEKEISVSPTASSRTVVTRDTPFPFFIKLHYEGLLGRVHRKLSRKRVLGASLISQDLDYLAKNGTLSDSFAYLPESYSLVTRFMDKEIGVTYREYRPRPMRQKRVMIPVFSLFSGDRQKPDCPTLLAQYLCDYEKRYEKFQEMVRLLIEAFRTITLDGGLWPENHAQNILLEMDSSGVPRRVIHRDLYEFYPDIQRRQRNGLTTQGFRKYLDINEDERLYYAQKSYLFDFKFGEYVLTPLIRDFCANFSWQIDKVIQDTKDIFRESSPEWIDEFSPYDSYFYFPPIEQTYVDNKPNLLEGKNPLYR